MMTFSEIKDYIQENRTDEDLPLNFEPDTDKVEKQVDKRADVAYLNRLKKCGKNPFKKWFYLGKGKDKVNNVYCKNTMFDDFRRKAFYKWRKRIEKKGVNIVRPYYKDYYSGHVHNYKLFKYYDYKYSNLWNRIRYGLQYSPHCSIWDMTDLMDYLIVKLTIMGVYHGGGFSHVLYHKQKMHTIWQARKMLIEATSAEDIFEYAKNLELKEHFHIDTDYYDLLDHWNPKDFIKTGKISKNDWLDDNEFNYSVCPEKLPELIDKSSYQTEGGRSLIVAKCQEIEKYWYSLDKETEGNFYYYLSVFTNIKIRKAFEFISRHFYEWGD